MSIETTLRCTLVEKGTESWGEGHSENQDFSIAKIEFLWRALKFESPLDPFYATCEDTCHYR